MSTTDKVRWDEVENAAAKMFNVWIDGAELKWAKEAWKHLAKAGLTEASTILEITATKLRLVTLAQIYQELSGFAWDENGCGIFGSPISGQVSRGTDVPVTIFLFPFSALAECVIPD